MLLQSFNISPLETIAYIRPNKLAFQAETAANLAPGQTAVVCRCMQVSTFLCVGSDFFPPPVVSPVFSPYEISRKGRAVGSGFVIVLGLGDSNAVTANAQLLL